MGQMQHNFYGKPAVQAAIDRVTKAASVHGIIGHEAALRWTVYHGVLDGRHGDGVIFSVSKLEQLTPTIKALEAGPLPHDLAEALSAIYETMDGQGPPYHL